MAVHIDQEKDDKVQLTIRDGDYDALRKIAGLYDLRLDDLIAFATGVLYQAGGRPVTIQQADGTSISLMPSYKLRIQRDSGVRH